MSATGPGGETSTRPASNPFAEFNSATGEPIGGPARGPGGEPSSDEAGGIRLGHDEEGEPTKRWQWIALIVGAVIAIIVLVVAMTIAVRSVHHSMAVKARDIHTPSGYALSAVFSPDGTKVLTTGVTGSMLWDAATGNQLLDLRKQYTTNELHAHPNDFSPDGTKLVIATTDAGVIVLDTTTGQRLATFAADAQARSAEFSPDGTHIVVSAPKAVTVWDAATFQLVRTLDTESLSATYSPDGRLIATVKGAITLWDASTGGRMGTIGDATLQATDVAFSPDGKFAVPTGIPPVAGGVYDVATGQQVITLHAQDVLSASFRADGTQLVVSGGGGPASVRRTSDGKQIESISVDQVFLMTVAYSRDGTHIVTTDGGDTATIWNVTDMTAS